MFRIMIIGNKVSALTLIDTVIHLIPGVTVISALSSTEALEILKYDQKFDVILLDSGVPLIMASQTFEQIKGRGITIPTVIMTQSSLLLDIQSLFNKGATEYLMQPYTAKSLLDKLERVSDVSLYESA